MILAYYKKIFSYPISIISVEDPKKYIDMSATISMSLNYVPTEVSGGGPMQSQWRLPSRRQTPQP
jgi:hypothetical protein